MVSCRGVTFGPLRILANPIGVHAVFLHVSVKNNSGKDKRVRMSFANVGEGSGSCDVKVPPDETTFCGGGLVQPGPTVRVTKAANDH